MTKEQILSTAAALVAFAEGRPWQLQGSEGRWLHPGSRDSIWNCISAGYILRPAPEAEPWDCMDDVPPICWLRDDENYVRLITALDEGGVWIGNCYREWKTLTTLKTEYSVDRKIWAPCVKDQKP